MASKKKSKKDKVENKEVFNDERKFRANAFWFYMMGGLAVLNALFFLARGAMGNSPFSLGFSYLLNWLSTDFNLGESMGVKIVLALAVLIYGSLFVVMGTFARRGKMIAYLAGIGLFVLDIGFLTMFRLEPSLLVRALVLALIVKGALAGRRWMQGNAGTPSAS